jgi:hypothetical protein
VPVPCGCASSPTAAMRSRAGRHLVRPPRSRHCRGAGLARTDPTGQRTHCCRTGLLVMGQGLA